MNNVVDEMKIQEILAKFGLKSEYPISYKDLANDINSCIVNYTLTNTINGTSTVAE